MLPALKSPKSFILSDLSVNISARFRIALGIRENSKNFYVGALDSEVDGMDLLKTIFVMTNASGIRLGRVDFENEGVRQKSDIKFSKNHSKIRQKPSCSKYFSLICTRT